MAPSNSKLSNNGKKLNFDQERVFNLIIADVEKTNKIKPLVLFVCGPAGTGKSLLISHLVNYVGIQHVIVSGTTAMAGKNVEAPTLHSVLKFNPSSDKDDEKLIPPHPFLKLFIIDEISMCSGKLFTRTERRIRQLLRNDNLFGGCTIVVFGDILQIPPVPEKGEPIDYIFNCQLWKNNVQYEELEISMRQENDPDFAQMLKRWRIGKYTEEDNIFLNEKAKKCPQGSSDGVVQYFYENYNIDKDMMLLAYTNPTIGLLNRKITYKIFKENELYDITEDKYSRKNDENISTIQHKLMFRSGIDGRVLISENINNGLVNGEIGIIRKIESQDNRIISMNLLLRSNQKTIKFDPISSSVTKTQDQKEWIVGFPIFPAYALTYHKAQGQTLDDVFLITSKDLPAALFYVGASRVRTREGLHVLTMDAVDSIRADSECLKEYKKLRVSIGKTPLPL